MKQILINFLHDVAQGLFGESNLTYSDIDKFIKSASKQDLEQLKEFYWNWNPELVDEGEIDIEELEEFIYSIINNQSSESNEYTTTCATCKEWEDIDKSTSSSLQEGTWSLPKNKNEIKLAQELLDRLKELKSELYNILGDDELFDGLDKALERGNELINHVKRDLNVINEATGSEFGLTQITKFKDNPLVTEILAIIKKKFKDLEVVNIEGSGDIWHLDLRFEIEEPSQQNQFTREKAKEQAYKIKYELEKEILAKFNIPSFAIRGIRTVKGKDSMYCEFVISLVYANKGNIKINYESKQQKIQSVLKKINESKLNINSINNKHFKHGFCYIADINGKKVGFLAYNVSPTTKPSEVLNLKDLSKLEGIVSDNIILNIQANFYENAKRLTKEEFLSNDLDIVIVVDHNVDNKQVFTKKHTNDIS